MDVIVASDIIFAKELHDSLSSLLVELLKVLMNERFTSEDFILFKLKIQLKVCTSPSPEAFIACTVRSDGMVQGFLKVTRRSILGSVFL